MDNFPQPNLRRPPGSSYRQRSAGGPQRVRPIQLTPAPAVAPAFSPLVSSQAAPSGAGARRHSRRLTYKLVTIGSVVAAVLMVAGAVAYVTMRQTGSLLPGSIRTVMTYPVLFPTKTTDFNVDSKTIHYDASAERLTFRGQGPGGMQIDFSEQATPQSFVDIPQAYDKLTSSLQEYDTFDSINGKVSLTHPKELGGDQSAVMNAKGTLLFARPNHGLSSEAWRQLFNNLVVVQ